MWKHVKTNGNHKKKLQNTRWEKARQSWKERRKHWSSLTFFQTKADQEKTEKNHAKDAKVPNLCNSVFGRHGLEPRQSQNGKFAIEQQKLRLERSKQYEFKICVHEITLNKSHWNVSNAGIFVVVTLIDCCPFYSKNKIQSLFRIATSKNSKRCARCKKLTWMLAFCTF